MPGNRRTRKSNLDDLLYMITNLNLTNLERLLVAGQDTNIQGSSGGVTVLIQCVKVNDPKRIDLLVNYAADVNKSDHERLSPLHWACMKQNEPMVNMLIKHGACVNTVSEDGVSPLIIALTDHNETIMRVLLNNNADVNLGHGSDGKRALHLAIGSDNLVSIVPEFIQSNARVNAVDLHGNTALSYAIKIKKLHVAEILLQHNARLDRGDPLMIAVEMGFVAGVQLLLSYGADPSQMDVSQCSNPLYKAIAYPYQDIKHQILRSFLTEDGRLTRCDSDNYILDVLSRLYKHVPSIQNSCFSVIVIGGLDVSQLCRFWTCSSRCICKQKLKNSLEDAAIELPLSLKMFSRNTIRKCLGVGITRKSSKLNLPKTLQMFLSEPVVYIYPISSDIHVL